MKQRMISFSPPDISELEIAEVAEALRSGWITTGPRTKLLERRLAAYIETGKTDITSQNHSYAVDENSLEGTGLVVTHKNLLDGTVEGVKCEKDKIFSVQYHPESSPGPHDSSYLFDEFLKLMD